MKFQRYFSRFFIPPVVVKSCQLRLWISREAGGVIELEGALDLEELAIAIIGHPFANEAASGLDDRLEGEPDGRRR